MDDMFLSMLKRHVVWCDFMFWLDKLAQRYVMWSLRTTSSSHVMQQSNEQHVVWLLDAMTSHSEHGLTKGHVIICGVITMLKSYD